MIFLVWYESMKGRQPSNFIFFNEIGEAPPYNFLKMSYFTFALILL